MAGKKRIVGLNDKVYSDKPIHLTTLKNWEKSFNIDAIEKSIYWQNLWEENEVIHISRPGMESSVAYILLARKLTKPDVVLKSRVYAEVVMLEGGCDNDPLIRGSAWTLPELFNVSIQDFMVDSNGTDRYILGLATLYMLRRNRSGIFNSIGIYPTLSGMVMLSRLMGVNLQEDQ